MSAKHTTGLRASDDAGIACGSIAGDDYRRIGTAYGWDREFEYDEAGTLVNSPQASEEAIANARLWAAAPELLEALEGVLRVADRATDEFDAARAAIAKATGSTA